MALSSVRLVALGALTLTVLAGPSALAQANSNMVQVEANEITYSPENNQARLSGQAVVALGETVLRANALTVFYRPNTQDIDRVVSDGEIFLTRGNQRMRGDRGVLIAATNTLTITGHVVVTQGRNVLEGAELVVNTRTNASTMRGIDGRVRAVFFQ